MMTFTAILLGALGVLVLVRVIRTFARHGAGLAARRGRRRSPREARHTDTGLLSALARVTNALGDERTWRDLDLEDVFHAIDYTASEIGRQCLYARLRTPGTDAERLAEFGARVAAITSDPRLAESIRARLAPLGDQRAAQLVDLFFDALPARPVLWWTFPILTALALASLAAMLVWSQAFVVFIVVMAVNLAVQMAYKPRVARFVPGIHELPTFLSAAEHLSALDAAALAPFTTTLGRARALRSLRYASSWLMFEPGQANEALAIAYEYVNMALLLNVNAFSFAIQRIRIARPELQRLFLALGELDLVQSVAAWRATRPSWSTPAFLPRQQRIEADDVVHPVLAAPVANSLSVDGAGVLVTGSNMAGKTTFIRTLGVNAVLAQTVFTVCARGWRAPPPVVRTSIGRADSLVEGKSYYLAEAESIRALLAAKESGAQHLFLMDEIVRGTNTTERIAAAYGVLRFLVKGDDLVFVATHDVELLGMLDDRFVGFHFAEQVSDSTLTFDYRLRPGPSSTRNAIALLRMLQYPEDVVSDALSVVDGVRPALS